jgi:hypothetical protein
MLCHLSWDLRDRTPEPSRLQVPDHAISGSGPGTVHELPAFCRCLIARTAAQLERSSQLLAAHELSNNSR